jgi:hypothetical protein
LVWDQTQDKLFNAFYNSDENAILPACGGGQPCKISLQYCSWADRKNDPGYGNNPVYSNGLAPEAGTIRAQELIQGQINHAVYLNAYCTSGAVVFPNLDRSSSGLRCDQQGKSNADRPPNGALFFLDYTAAQIVAMSLPPWQKTILNAIATYGAYLGDTGGAHDTLDISHFEAGQAYRYYGIEDPLWYFLDQACPGTGCQFHSGNYPASDRVYTLNFLANIPLVDGKDVTHHMHIADPCVAKALAGLSAAQGACL